MNQELIEKSLELEVYSPLKAQLEELKKKNEHIVFSYNNEAEIKEVNKYIRELRKSKKAIAEVHKKEKAESLAYGRTLDAGKNHLSAEIDSMIEVHERPIKEMKAREQARQDVIAEIRDTLMQAMTSNKSSEDLAQEIARVKEYNFSGFEDSEEIAMGAKAKTLEGLEKLHKLAVENEKAEAEKAEKEKAEMIERMQKEATAKAQADAKAAIEAEKNKALLAVQQEKDRAAKEQRRIEDEEKARLSNVEYKKSVNNGIVSALLVTGISMAQAQDVVKLAARGEAGNLFVKY